MTKHPLSDLDGDIRDHIERETEDNIARGMSPREARHAALRRFGSVTLAREAARGVWVPVWLDQLRQDLRYGLRMLHHNPVFTAVAVLTLALGIGLTTAVFSVAHAVLIRPLPYADADRIVFIQERFREQIGNASAGHFHDWSEHATVFEYTAAGQGATFNLAGEGDPERVRGMRVTPGYFDVARITPAVGRYFTQQDVENDARLVVLSYSLWLGRFAGDRSIVGRQIRLGGERFTVVGVAPAAYSLTDPSRAGVTGGFSAQLWTPLTFTPELRNNFGNHSFGVLAKLKPGVTYRQAQADLERVTAGIAERHPMQMESRGVALVPLLDELVGDVKPQLFVLAGAVGFVLLIGCVNIASLLVARAAVRRREIAIRGSLGGGQSRIVRQLLTESFVLAVTGGLVALVVARAAIDFFVNRGPATLPRLHESRLSLPVLVFELAITGLAAVLFGLTPAIRAARADLQSSLRRGGAPLKAAGRDRVRTTMVVAETAITVVLLIGTGLLWRSAEKLRQVPLGFDPDSVVTARMTLPANRYQEDQHVADAYRRILETLRRSQGVRYAAASSHVPLMSGNSSASTVAEGKTFSPGSAPDASVRLVTDDYFEAIGMRMRLGRSFDDSDVTTGAARVVVINERLAAALWPGESPVGKRLSTWSGPDNPEWREVVGVAADARSFGQSAPIAMELFIPYTQAPSGAWIVYQRSMALVVRSAENWPETYVPAMRRAVRDVDPSIPLYDVRTMESAFMAVTATRRLSMQFVLVLAASGLGLALLGLYGVISYFVSQRTPEIGLRLAVGAGKRDVVRMVIAQALRLAIIGLVIGIPAAFALTRVMTTLLFEIEPTDPITFASVAILLVATSLAAATIPSMKAARVDPLVALRHE
jgi:putative ABC transport system permease protein